jgi:hypothetical protein
MAVDASVLALTASADAGRNQRRDDEAGEVSISPLLRN